MAAGILNLHYALNTFIAGRDFKTIIFYAYTQQREKKIGVGKTDTQKKQINDKNKETAIIKKLTKTITCSRGKTNTKPK